MRISKYDLLLMTFYQYRPQKKHDFVMCIDVLEHVDEPKLDSPLMIFVT